MAKKVTITAIKKAMKEMGKPKKQKIEGLNIQIKQYNGIKIKEAIVRLIIQNCIIDGKINHCIKDMAYEMSVLRYYTNIDFSTVDSSDDMIEKLIEFYDLLKENRIIDYVISNINKDEIDFLENNLHKQLQEEVRPKETIEDLLKSFLKDITNKIPDKEGMLDLLTLASKEFKNFDPEKLGITKDMLNALGQEKKAEFVGNSKENVKKVVNVAKKQINNKKK